MKCHHVNSQKRHGEMTTAWHVSASEEKQHPGLQRVWLAGWPVKMG